MPEEFAPTGPKLSRFVIRPPPPVKPRLFEDEARFAVRLALLAGGTELAAWAWITRAHSLAPLVLAALILAALRLLRPFWAWTGTRLPRPLVAFTLIAVALLAQGAAIFTLGGLAFAAAAAVAAGLSAVGDLAATTIADSVTVERRAAAYAWLDMGQGLGIALGIALGAAAPRLVPVGAAAALFLAGLGIPDLHDRGTPRSSWLLRSFAEVARTPLASQLALLAAGIGAACSAALAGSPVSSASASLGTLVHATWAGPWALAAAPLAGMAVAARIEERSRNAVLVPRGLLILALVAFALHAYGGGLLALAVLGAAAAALPASVARGAGEMHRPLASSLVWMALALGAFAGSLLGRW